MLAVHCAAPALPCLVKIWMTPPEASVPYSVVADGPFTISMWSMSSGAMSLSGEDCWPPPVATGPLPLKTRTPST